MEDEKCPAEPCNTLSHRLLAVEVVEELLADAERPPADADLGLTFRLDLGFGLREQLPYVPRIIRRTNGGDSFDTREPFGNGQHGSTTE